MLDARALDVAYGDAPALWGVSLTIAAGELVAVVGPNGELPENAKLSVWVSEKDKFPIKMQVSASGKQNGEDFSLNMDLNVTDLNGNVTIDAPR